ncbi:MAG: arylsulfotransferase family protein, partial [Bacteroidales bacterium]
KSELQIGLAMPQGVFTEEERPYAPDKAPELNGVVLLNCYKCYDGYRLYSSRQTQEAHLIDINGKEVHSWSYPQGEGHNWHLAEMLPNGNLIAIDKGNMTIELDWESNLIWKAEGNQHHDFYKYANGNIIVLDMEQVSGGIGKKKDDDSWKISFFREYNGDQVVWEWHQYNHLDEIANLIEDDWDMRKEYDGSHTNCIEVLPENSSGKKDSRFKKGNILFSDKNINTIGIINKESGRVVWAKWVGVGSAQHMPTMLPNGHILYYDNNGHNGNETCTRIVEFNPITGEVVWEYWGDPPKSFYSRMRGSNQRLPNGNTFIAESDAGRLFEVTPDGEIVWEFLNPDHYSHRNRGVERQPIYRAYCYQRDLVQELLDKYEGIKKTE